ncbi:transcriptional regulator [Virgibacillus profundi]|uniref:Transcriptional regulator n=1 Tax=Virgibacillus profundi TaxID=2024555 RepID=A0A2A2I8K8_9BACI|nr:PadR family transcriptional regulator [Virgibacillus profundi]PAV28049.1 transcriptional regulator [Virgibacillus profundi]PXY52353.1 PadR family transcriptional regulator [Virgibacillus profundi]
MTKYNNTKYALLGLLTTGCRTGYAIKQMIDTSLNHFWKISYGQIYPTLKQLVEDGLATVKETSQEGRPKKEYFLTPKGELALQAWLQSPIKEIPAEKNKLLLKLFFGRHQSNEDTTKQLENYQQELQKRYETYEEIEKMITSHKNEEADATYWLFTLDYGKRMTIAAMEWCEDTIEKIRNWKDDS